MSEVDRLSNSGLYPALPIADKRSRNGSANQPPVEKRTPPAPPENKDQGRPPKSLIDEYV